jgi:hypothetical protein
MVGAGEGNDVDGSGVGGKVGRPEGGSVGKDDGTREGCLDGK